MKTNVKHTNRMIATPSLLMLGLLLITGFAILFVSERGLLFNNLDFAQSSNHELTLSSWAIEKHLAETNANIINATAPAVIDIPVVSNDVWSFLAIESWMYELTPIYVLNTPTEYISIEDWMFTTQSWAADLNCYAGDCFLALEAWMFHSSWNESGLAGNVYPGEEVLPLAGWMLSTETWVEVAAAIELAYAGDEVITLSDWMFADDNSKLYAGEEVMPIENWMLYADVLNPDFAQSQLEMLPVEDWMLSSEEWLDTTAYAATLVYPGEDLIELEEWMISTANANHEIAVVASGSIAFDADNGMLPYLL